MSSCKILGTGAVGGFGCGKTGLLEVLQLEAISTTSLPIETAEGDVSINLCKADLSRLKEYFPSRLTRRYDHFAKMVAFAAQQALNSLTRI